MVVLAGLVISAAQVHALSGNTVSGSVAVSGSAASGSEAGSDRAVLAGAAAPLAQAPAKGLPFVEGAPPPLAIVALGVLVIGVTFTRRLRKSRSQA